MKDKILAVALVAFACATATGQTVISDPPNRYSPAEDVELGRQAAAQAERELRILADEQVEEYVARLGRRLVDATRNHEHREFRYSFKIVDAPEINAFALPGGPMYVNRGMMQAARNEGEIAGVMAHELSHVLLRHGTAQATKATKYQFGQLAGAVLGAIVGGRTGQVIAQGSQFGIGAAFLRFSREYERQADLMGAQIIASAGYDPRDMANMFRTIAQKSRNSGGPEWLSDHPDPGNRYEYVIREAQTLEVRNPIRDSTEFQAVQRRLSGTPRTSTARAAGSRTARAGRVDAHGVEAPSSEFRSYEGGDVFEVRVPENWHELVGTNGVTFAPEGAYAQGTFSHGVEIGFAGVPQSDLKQATRSFIQSLRKANPQIRERSARAAILDGRQAIETVLANGSSAGGAESVRIVTTNLDPDTLFYIVAVVPTSEDAEYQPVFDRILQSIRLVR